MKEIKGDALKVFEKCPRGVLVHQVNCRGVMNSGIAKQIRQSHPEHFEDYKKAPKVLGDFVMTNLSETKQIVGVFGQSNYGYDRNRRYTNYAGLARGISELVQFLVRTSQGPHKPVVIVPKYIGCGLGGGDWDIVEQLIIDFEAVYPVTFVVVEYEEKGGFKDV